MFNCCRFISVSFWPNKCHITLNVLLSFFVFYIYECNGINKWKNLLMFHSLWSSSLFAPVPFLTPLSDIWFTRAGISKSHDLFRICSSLWGSSTSHLGTLSRQTSFGFLNYTLCPPLLLPSPLCIIVISFSPQCSLLIKKKGSSQSTLTAEFSANEWECRANTKLPHTLPHE